MTDDAPGVELAIRAQPVLPMAPDQARQMMQAFQELSASILERDDMQDLGDRRFVKRSGFQKLAAAYGVSTELVTTVMETVTRDDDKVLVARVVARATHPSGRHADGDGTCASNETRFRKGDQRMEHNLTATAATRAVNRAVSNLVAFGAVSAEEAEAAGQGSGGGREATQVLTSGWAAPVDVSTAAQALNRLFENAGVQQENRHKIVTAIGNATLDQCDGGFPKAVLDVITRINEELFTAHAAEELDGTEITSESDLDTPAGRAADAMAEDFARAAEEDKNTITTEDDA